MAAPDSSLADLGAPRLTLLPQPAPPSRARARHYGLAMLFLATVAAPLGLAAWYLWWVAADQYASTVGFSVRKEEVASPIELFGGIADISSSGSSDSDILYEFIQSQEIVETLEAQIGLSTLWSRPDDDPVFAHEASGTVEDLRDFWRRMVRVTYDTSTELVEVRALAFTPEDARRITTAVFDESARLVEDLSAIARADTIAFAEVELARAVDRLKAAREAVTAYRSRTQIVDPTADLQGQMGLLSTLETQLAEALIAADLLRDGTRDSDPRIQQADLRIRVIEARIAEERRKLGVGTGESGQDYASLLAEYERLAVDRQFAEEAYTVALAAYVQALAEARRKSRYLAAYIRPTTAEAAEFPRKEVLLAALAFFLLSGWGVVVLLYYSIRDRR